MIKNQFVPTARPQSSWLYWIVVAIFAMLVLLVGGPVRAANKPKKMPSMDKVREHTLRYLSGTEDYQPGDMLARSQVEPLFKILFQMGWKVSDKKNILIKLPADRDFLFQQFQSPEGMKFMRQISKDSANYSRLDQLSWTKGGRLRVVAIIKSPNGPQTTEALAVSKTDKDTKRRSSKSKGAAKSNAKIYTATQFIERLTQSHVVDTAWAKRATKKSARKNATAN